MRRFAFLFAACIVLISLSACRDQKNLPVDRVHVAKGENQCAPAESAFKPVMVYVYGKEQGTWYSRGADAVPLPGREVFCEPEDGSDLLIEPHSATTDPGGIVTFSVRAGKKTGDQYLKIYPAGEPDKALRLRFTSGVERLGDMQEASAGARLGNSVGIRLTRPDGSPAQGVPVYFTSKATLGATNAVTDENGEARTALTLGNRTGSYEVGVEVPNAGTESALRPVTIRALGLNLYSLLINVFGGLAIFVFGMKLMSDGLQKAAGERMRSILHLFSSNRYVAIAAGALVTAVVQSSSASTVMVIGFVNAGLLNLVQSIGTIFGANIGTTITAQIISFNISAIAMPAIIVGLLLGFIHWQKLRGWGETVLGFGLLFYGMTIMSSELKLIAVFPSFVDFFKTFECAPVNGFMPFRALLGTIVVGMFVTVLVQSSSAATGIVIALASSGLIDFYTGVVLVMGSNIGTTITAQLAALAANRIAKQAALAHTLFNVIGVLVLTGTFWIRWPGTDIPVFFYVVNLITGGNAFAAIPQNVPRHIANAHTLFNVFATLLLMPLIPLFASLCERFIPLRSDKKIKYQYLEPHLLDTPPVALEQSVFAIRKMLKKAWKMVDRSFLNHFIPALVDEERFANFAKREKRIDRYQLEITDYLVKITRRSLSKSQADIIPLLMHCTNDAERIADHTDVILSLTRRLAAINQPFSDLAKDELLEIYAVLKSQAVATITALDQYDAALVAQAIADEAKIIELAEQFEANHIARLNKGECSAETGIIFIEMLAEFTKVSHHIENIAERANQISINYRIVKSETKPGAPRPSVTIENIVPVQAYPDDAHDDDDSDRSA